MRVSISGIKQAIEKNIDYSWTKPQTYLVLVPVISLIIQKVKFAKEFNLINSDNNKEKSIVSKDFANICKWHLRGSMMQMIVAIVALVFSAVNPIFALIAIISAYEALSTVYNGFGNQVTLHTVHPDGSYSLDTRSPISIFWD